MRSFRSPLALDPASLPEFETSHPEVITVAARNTAHTEDAFQVSYVFIVLFDQQASCQKEKDPPKAGSKSRANC
jgi:hypothetical protein